MEINFTFYFIVIMNNQKYFRGKEENGVQIYNLRKFHRFVKSYLYNFVSKKIRNREARDGKKIDGISLLELAAGRGSDIHKYANNDIRYILAIDSDKNALEKFKNKYAKRFKNKIRMDFKIANASKNITNIIGKQNVKFDIVSIQFAFHYFLSNEETLNNIFLNIDTYLKRGGYFIFTTFDGEKIFEILKKKKYANQFVIKKDSEDILKIKKLYLNDTIKKYGQKIDVCVETIGCHIEYLVNYNFIIDNFTEKGYKLIETNNFSHLLGKFYQESGIRLSESEKIFSLLNRYTILQKL